MINNILWQDGNVILTNVWAIIGADTSHLRKVHNITQEQLADTIRKVYAFECVKTARVRFGDIPMTFDGHNRFTIEGMLFNAVEILIIINLLGVKLDDVLDIDIFDDGITLYHNGAMATIMKIEEKNHD